MNNSLDNERFALAYLERYGNMIHAQDEEDYATIKHLRPIFHTIQRLGGSGISQQHRMPHVHDTSFTANAENTFLYENATGTSLVGGLHDNSSFSTPPQSSLMTSTSSICHDDELTFETMRRFKDEPMILSSDDSKDYEVLKTDQQLCLVLKTIVESMNFNNKYEDEGISFAEFVHVYKIAVSGMQSLQMLPALGKNSPLDSNRKRARSRCVQMIRLFARVEVAAVDDDLSIGLVSTDDQENENSQTGMPAFYVKEEGKTVEFERLKESEAQIEILMDEVSAGRRRSNILWCLLLLTTSTVAGFYMLQPRNVKDIEETIQNENNAIFRPAPEDYAEIPEDTLFEIEKELDFAKAKVGSLVLEVEKVQTQLFACLDMRSAQQTKHECEPCMKNNTANIELKRENSLRASNLQQQIRTVLTTAVIMALPTFLPASLFQKSTAIFTRFFK